MKYKIKVERFDQTESKLTLTVVLTRSEKQYRQRACTEGYFVEVRNSNSLGDAGCYMSPKVTKHSAQRIWPHKKAVRVAKQLKETLDLWHKEFKQAN